MRKEAQKKHDALDALVKNDGLVTSTFHGTITEVAIGRGQKTTGDERIAFSTENPIFQFELGESEVADVHIGDAVTLMDGTFEVGDLVASDIEAAPVPDVEAGEGATAEPTYVVSCTGEGEDASLGKMQDFVIQRIDTHDVRIPIGALREDGNGKYHVLTLGEEQTVLGVQTVAKRVEVALISHDGIYAAVEGSLTMDDGVIISSNKPIADGDRVEVKDDE